MATTAAEAWDGLTVEQQQNAHYSTRDAFFLGFAAGWQAQENRPFHCTYCGTEMIGETDAETILLAQDHTRGCEIHPLAIENRELRDAIDHLRSVLDGVRAL